MNSKYRCTVHECNGVKDGGAVKCLLWGASQWLVYHALAADADKYGAFQYLEFLQAVQPAYAVISVGKDNGYGHPHREVLARLAEIGAETLRTDEVGTVRMRSDGTELVVY